MFTSFVSKLLVSTAMLFCMVQVGIGQYNVDSVRILRDQKLEQFSNDPNAPLTAEDIRYINYYEPDSTYVVHGRVELLRGEQPFRMPTSDGTSDHLFLPFTDATNGVETYGGGRYID